MWVQVQVRRLRGRLRPKFIAYTALASLVSFITMLLPVASSPQAFAASGSVTTPAVALTSSSAGASQVTYKISFSVSATGGLQGGQGTIDLIAPKGTVWPSQASNYEIEDQTTPSATGPSSTVNIADNGAVAVITVPNSINNADSLTVKVLGVTSPVVVGSYTIGVQTSSDPALVESASYSITAATPVSSPSASLSTTSSNATGTSWYVSFTLSSQGQLVGGQGTITLVAPEGTQWPYNCQSTSGRPGFYITDLTDALDGGAPVACAVAGSTATLTVKNTIPASTSSTPQVSVSTTAANASGVTYSITFQASSNGSLAGKSNLMGQASTIALTGDAGTIWPSSQSNYTYIDHTANSPRAPIGADGLSVLVSNNGTSVGQIAIPKSVNAGDIVTLVIAGVTNPPVSTSNAVSVSTSSDTVSSVSTPYTTTASNAVSAVSVSASSTVAGALGVTYKVALTTSDTGHLSGGQSSIYLTASAGTILPSSSSSYSIVDNTTPSGSGHASGVHASGSDAVISAGSSITAGDSIVLAISGVSNPVDTGAAPLYIYTSSDLVPVVYSSFSITNGGSPVNPVMYMSSSTPSKTGVNYTIDFNTSSSGALGTANGGSSSQGSSITVTAPALTGLSSASFTLIDESGGINSNGTPTGPVQVGPSSQISVSGGFAVATMYVSANIAASSTVTIQMSRVTNAPSPDTFYISTSSDTTAAKISLLASVSTPTVTAVSPPSGSTSGGYNVIVGGTGMSLATQVSFGGSPAAFTISSATAVIAVAPRGSPGELDITVVNPGGTSATVASDKFTYVASSPPTSPAGYVPVTPMRLADTRCGTTPEPTFCKGENLPTQNSTLSIVNPNSSINVTVTGVDGIPTSGTTAVALNVTLVNPAAKGGFLAVYPASSSGGKPTISNINWSTAGADIPNLVMAEVGQNNQVTIYNGSSGTANVTVDIEGYYSTTASSADTYNPVTPVRLADTRCSAAAKPSFCTSTYIPSQNAGLKTLAPLAQENVMVAGVAGIPSNATAVVLNVTIANTNSSGFLTVWPTGKTRAVVSNLNWTAGKAVANRVVVPVGSGGDVSVFNGAAQGVGNFIVDISGYYSPSSSSGSSLSGQFSAVSPIRICDTRSPSITGYTTECSAKGYLPPGGTMLVQVTGIDGIPTSGISAVVANVTVAGSTAAGGYLSVLPGGTSVSAKSPPTISDLNWGSPEENVANLVVAKLGSGGTIEIFNSSGNAKVIVDVMGWYS
ncbi:MAG: beta strand repeat-containing protein [Acidimicrobiales bacterium]